MKNLDAESLYRWSGDLGQDCPLPLWIWSPLKIITSMTGSITTTVTATNILMGFYRRICSHPNNFNYVICLWDHGQWQAELGLRVRPPDCRTSASCWAGCFWEKTTFYVLYLHLILLFLLPLLLPLFPLSSDFFSIFSFTFFLFFFKFSGITDIIKWTYWKDTIW